MNDLEQKLYTKGLENLYGSVLLGEECALNHIENLVYLTRELTAPPLSRLPVSEETAFIQGFCAACWPDAPFSVRLEGVVAARQVLRRQLSGPVCRLLLKLERHGKIPEKMVVWQEDGIVCYRLESGGRMCAQGVAADEQD